MKLLKDGQSALIDMIEAQAAFFIALDFSPGIEEVFDDLEAAGEHLERAASRLRDLDALQAEQIVI